jgi:hypothetical protein
MCVGAFVHLCSVFVCVCVCVSERCVCVCVCDVCDVCVMCVYVWCVCVCVYVCVCACVHFCSYLKPQFSSTAPFYVLHGGGELVGAHPVNLRRDILCRGNF